MRMVLDIKDVARAKSAKCKKTHIGMAEQVSF